jgi:hypothetical protein
MTGMYRKLIFIAFIFISCIDFDIDAPYDDINGIYLENVKSYGVVGKKLVVENERGYVRGRGSTDHHITCYDFSDVYDIDTLSIYQSVYTKPDFAVSDGYAYIVSKNFGLEIVDFNRTTPELVGFLPISANMYSITLSNATAYIAGTTTLYTIDINDVENPVPITEYVFNDSIISLEIVSDTLYILQRDGNLQIIDIAIPTSPQLITEHSLSDTFNLPYYFVKQGEYLYVAKGYDIETYEIQGNSDVKYLNTLSFSHSIDFLQTFDHFGIVLYNGFLFDRLYLLNLTHPSRPCIGEYVELEDLHPVHAVMDDQYIFLLLSLTLRIIEIRDIQ